MRRKTNQAKWMLCVLFLLLTVCAATEGGIIYVDADAVGANDGSSWANAFSYLQDALITASAGDEIRVAEGTYRPNQGLLPLPDRRGDRRPGEVGRSAAFGLKAGLIVEGGFAGFSESDPNERDPEIYETILSGDLDGNDVDVNDPYGLVDESTRAENSYNVLTSYEDGSDTTLDGFTITSATKGGLANYGGSPCISNCVFTKNSNDDSGGAIVNYIGSTILTRCRFATNYAVQHGGAIYSDNGNDVLIECSFVENSALDGTGIVNIEGNLELESCTFSHNSTYSSSSTDEDGGGAVFIVSKKVVVKNCLFNGNVARYGGAIVGVADVLTLEECVFTGNSAECGGAIYDLRGGTITNCIFAGNRAEEGGAICGRCVGPSVINCTLFSNAAQNGNAISWFPCLDGSPFIMNITNCILRNGGDEIGKRNGRLPDNAITYSNIQGGWPGEGNIDIDPLFAHPENGDFHLKSQAGRWDANSHNWIQDDVTSPCIDAGDPNGPIGHEPFPNGGIVNMGAYGGTIEASKSPSGLHAKYGGGTGQPDDPYLIYTAAQMNNIGIELKDWDRYFKLMADIDLSGYTGTDFNIIGDGFLPAFTGVFDGNGHTISNFTCDNVGSHGVGIFGCVDDPNARISNLGLIDPNVGESQGIAVGSLAGWIERGTIANCYVVNGNVTGYRSVGGLVGHNGGTITNCHVIGNVTGATQIGGLVGSNQGLGIDGGWYGRGHIDRSYATGAVSGHSGVGGLIGNNHEAMVTNSYSIGDIFGESLIGGLVGNNEGYVGNCHSASTIDAEYVVGGLVGRNEGIVMASYASVSLRGEEEVGGLVGCSLYQGEIVDCYATGDVVGQSCVGGLLGRNRLTTSHGGGAFYGAVRTSYSATVVSGEEYVGGLVGRGPGPGSGVHDSFWDIETSGQTTSAGGTGKTTAEMQTGGTFLSAGWDFADETENGTEDIWTEPDGGGYPLLWWQLSPSRELPTFSGGTGAPNDPYLISTSDELRSIGHKPELMTARFRLVNDIDLAGIRFSMIGSRWYPFCGAFDGNGHTISNFTYASSDTGFIGLFRYVAGGQIRDLGLVGPTINVDEGDFHGGLAGYLDTGSIANCFVQAGSISGRDYVGGLVGMSTGVITNCHAAGSVAGYGDYVGGLVGENNLTVTDCYANCSVDGAQDDVGGLVGRNNGMIVTSYSQSSVKGRNAVGGLVGRHNSGQTINCHAHGDVTGRWYVGGLVGSNGTGTRSRDLGAIRHCYSATTILGGSQSGGLLGVDWGGEVLDCFWDIEVSGRSTSYGGTGKTTAEMQTEETFLEAGWDFVGEIENGTQDVWRILEGQDYPRLWWELSDERE